MDLINEVFPEKDAKVLENLWQDDSSSKMHLGIARQVGKRLSQKGIVLSSAQDQLFALLSQADFAYSESEVVYVAGTLMHVLPKKDVLPFVVEQEGYELASRCLVSLGLFINQMYHRTKYRGAPTPEFYREVGKSTFNKLGQREVSDNFKKWEYFLSENFV